MKRVSQILMTTFMCLLLTSCAKNSPAPPPATLQVTTASLPAAVVNQLYAEQLTANGGTAPYTWSVISGTLSPGITLSSSGVLSGIPTSPGTYQFTLQVTDSLSANVQVQIKIEWRTV